MALPPAVAGRFGSTRAVGVPWYTEFVEEGTRRIAIAVYSLFLFSAPAARADEVCPGCMGGGKVGCTGCAGPSFEAVEPAGSLRPLGFLPGSWKGEESDDKGNKLEGRWEACLGGSGLRSTETSPGKDGKVSDYVSMLGCAEDGVFVSILFAAPGRVVVLTGKQVEEAFQFEGQGIRWTIQPTAGGRQTESRVEVREGEDKRRLVSRSRGTRSK